MSLANALRKTGLSLSDALKRAWATIRLKAKMLIKPTAFAFRKDNGTTRQATGYYGAAPKATGETKPSPILQIHYFDLDCNDWRSFRADRLIIA